MLRVCGGAALSLLVLVGSGLAHAGTVELAPAKDATIWRTGNVNGAGDNLFVGQAGGGAGPDSFRRILMEFDLSGISSSATVTSAVLTLTPTNGKGSNAFIESHPLTQDWLEGDQSAGSGIGSFPVGGNDVTWTSTGLAPWATDGGDFLAADAIVLNPPAVFTPFDLSGPALTATVQSWIDGSLANHGWLLLGVENEFQQVRGINSREAQDAMERPRLTITTVMPEPGTWLLMAVGLGALALRRSAN